MSSELNTYNVTVMERRIYKTVYQVKAKSQSEAKRLVDEYDERIKEVSDEFTDSAGYTIINCKLVDG